MSRYARQTVAALIAILALFALIGMVADALLVRP